MFLLGLVTAIITLLWSVQLFAIIDGSGIFIWINLLMMISWTTLAYVFVHKELCPIQKNNSQLLEILINN
jgi:hypothetical protein